MLKKFSDYAKNHDYTGWQLQIFPLRLWLPALFLTSFSFLTQPFCV